MKLNRLSLNVVGLNRIGLNRIGSPSRGSSSGSDRPYIDPEVLASLKAVCICYGKSNDDPDRAIVKNLVDPDNPFVISNAAFTEGSGYADKDSPYYGAFVTDGIDDLITSTKSATEMLDGSNEITVVSMIHQIKTNSDVTRNNWFFTPVSYLENRVVENKTGKTGIYGYTSTNVTNAQISDITPILGDKNDYTLYSKIEDGDRDYFTVEGFQNQGIWYVSSIAWYWTIIANKVLTTDQINQVIAYFNLDRTLKPDILCDVKKQGITNENHAEFGDKLIDYSGNGRDIQLNNIAWKGDSGIGKYSADFESFDWAVNISQKQHNKATISLNGRLCNHTAIEVDEMKVNIIGNITELIYWYIANPDDTTRSEIRLTSGINTLPKSYAKDDGQTYNIGFAYISGDSEITIEQIPSHAGALCLDGVNDFGKVTGMPIYKDYTFISKYQRLSYREAIEIEGGAVIASKSYSPNQGAFIFNGVRGDYVHDCYSFGLSSSNNLINDKNLEVYYQTKYTNQGKSISSGTAADSDILWLGTVRDNDTRFINAAIYFLMSFPYSMSEFLIERQLKKHKLGTLYPDMVEFRPIIKANNDYEIVYTAIIKPDNWQQISVGDYVTVGESVAIQIKLNNPLEVTNVSSNSLADVSFYKEETGDNIYTIYGRLLDGKSPQKIGITIEQDENYVLFNPTINSNAVLEVGNEETMPELFTQLNNGEIDGIILYMQGDKAVLPNNWIDKNTKVRAIIYCLDTVSEEDIHFTVDGKTKYCYSAIEDGLAAFGIMDEDSQEEQYMTNVLTANTIDIQLDQYIRYEDIVQPYPVLLRFNDENGNEVSWGGKFRVGSTITRIGSIADPESNLLNGLYSISGLSLNGKAVTSSTSIVEKQMVFKTTATYLLDNNEPKCILSPRLLRIPNSSYKILGHIPDISGHGNHGVIHNSAYAEESGANEDGSYQFDGVDDFVTIPTLSSGGKQVLMKVNWWGVDDGVIYDQRNGTTAGVSNQLCFSLYPDSIAYQFRNVGGKTFIDGILNNNIVTQNLKGITHNITSITNYDINNSSTPFIGANAYSNKSYVPTALYDFMLFDKISTDDKIKELNEYVGIEPKVELPPYYWDAYGKTNLDEDKNYTANLGTVKDVIQVSQPAIFAENWYDGNPEPVLSSPIINQTDYSIEVKANKMDNNFTMMLDVECDTPLPAFKAKFSMVGTAISVDLKYYINGGSKIIDVFKSGGSTEPVILDIPASERSFIYGTNTDNYPNILIEILPADNGTRYGLTNTNFAYDKMSGFGGYEFAKFDNTSEWSARNREDGIEVIERNAYSFTAKRIGAGTYFWDFNNHSIKTLNRPLTLKAVSNNNTYVRWEFKYRTAEKPDVDSTIILVQKEMTPNVPITVTLPYKTEQEITDLGVTEGSAYYLFYFDPTNIPIGEEYTIKMLPLYPNGLVYDGVTDYSENSNIPALTDYTYVFKRELLDLDKASGTASMYKGSFVPAGGRAFIADYYINTGGLTDGTYGFSYGSSVKSPTLLTDKIVYGTKTSVNGVSISPSSPDLHKDDASLTLGKWDVNFKQMAFYKLILYPKTIPLLQINFLKNLMERDEIIDLNNPIFIQE